MPTRASSADESTPLVLGETRDTGATSRRMKYGVIAACVGAMLVVAAATAIDAPSATRSASLGEENTIKASSALEGLASEQMPNFVQINDPALVAPIGGAGRGGGGTATGDKNDHRGNCKANGYLWIPNSRLGLPFNMTDSAAELGRGGRNRNRGNGGGGGSNKPDPKKDGVCDRDSPIPGFCWKDVSFRGMTFGQGCADNKEQIGALCYDKCPSGYKRFGVDCHQECKQGDTDTGLFCALGDDSSYDRGSGKTKWFGSCPSSRPSQCGELFGCCYKRCRSGYEAIFPDCRKCKRTCDSAGYSWGAFGQCAKKIKHSPGISAQKCPSSHPVSTAFGLCYENCGNNLEGDGPLCTTKEFTHEGYKWKHCGLGMAGSTGTCNEVIADQAISTITTMASLVALASPAGLVAKVLPLFDKATEWTQILDAQDLGTEAATLDQISRCSSSYCMIKPVGFNSEVTTALGAGAGRGGGGSNDDVCTGSCDCALNGGEWLSEQQALEVHVRNIGKNSCVVTGDQPKRCIERWCTAAESIQRFDAIALKFSSSKYISVAGGSGPKLNHRVGYLTDDEKYFVSVVNEDDFATGTPGDVVLRNQNSRKYVCIDPTNPWKVIEGGHRSDTKCQFQVKLVSDDDTFQLRNRETNRFLVNDPLNNNKLTAKTSLTSRFEPNIRVEDMGGETMEEGECNPDCAPERVVESLANIIAILDPTGITGTVLSYAHPRCSDPDLDMWTL